MTIHRPRPLRTLFAAAIAILGIATAPHGYAQSTTAGAATMVSRGSDGSHIIGDPAAPVRLVEYVSYTCPHCKDFVDESRAALRRHIEAGRLNVEVRHLVLSAPDIGMTVAAQCGSPARFHARHEALFAIQPAVLERASTLSRARADAIVALPPLARIRALAEDTGVVEWMRQRGFTASQIDRCFADQGVVDRIEAMRNAALQSGVTGTPTFAINGEIVANAHNWRALQPLIDAAVGAVP